MEIPENFMDGIKKLGEKLIKTDLKFSEIYSKGAVKLAEYGWYIGANVKVSQALDAIIFTNTNNKEKIDEIFINYYSENLEELSKAVIEKYSERDKILKEVIKCHNSKLYFASTTLFLSQVDGICNGELFKTKRSKSSIKKFIKDRSDKEKISSTLNPILEENAIDVYHPNKDKFKSDLNRHGVMHGYDFDFGTETNSLKSFSLLCYIKDFIDRYNNIK